MPYVTLGDRASAPLGEAKPEWEIFARLAAHVARGGAAARHRRAYAASAASTATSTTLDERFTDDGRFGPDAQEAVTEFILQRLERDARASPSPTCAARAARCASRASARRAVRPASSREYSSNEPVVPLRDFVEKKQPYPTLTGRQQFYIDHPWFLEARRSSCPPTRSRPPPAARIRSR